MPAACPSTSPSGCPVEPEVQARLKAFIAGAARLPVLPDVTLRLLNTVDDPDRSAHEVAAIVETDPALAARLLKLANSSFYGQRGRIAGIRNAVVVLGSKTIRSLALAVWTTTIRARGQAPGEVARMEQLLLHGLTTGVAAGLLADRVGHGLAEDAFVAGLLHDLGRVALLAQLGQGYADDVLDAAAHDQVALQEREVAVLGFDHRDLGAALMGAWGLPGFLADVAQHHHDADIVPRDRLFVAATALADDLATRAGRNIALTAPRPAREDLAGFFRLEDPQAAAALLDHARLRVDALASALA